MKKYVFTALLVICASKPDMAYGHPHQGQSQPAQAFSEQGERLWDSYEKSRAIFEHLFDKTFPPEVIAISQNLKLKISAKNALFGIYNCLSSGDLSGAQNNLNNHRVLRDKEFKGLRYPDPKIRDKIWELRATYTQYLLDHGVDQAEKHPGLERLRKVLRIYPGDITQEDINALFAESTTQRKRTS